MKQKIRLSLLISCMLFNMAACGEKTKSSENMEDDLKNTEQTEIQQDEKVLETTEQDEEKLNKTSCEDVDAIVKNAYAQVLMAICYHDAEVAMVDEYLFSGIGFMSDDSTFAFADINGDNIDELIVDFQGSCSANMELFVYGYDNEKNEVYRWDTRLYPSVTFYDNGVAKEEWSHNQGYGMKLWPYTLYSYNKETNSYDEIGYVDSWEKEVMAENFPDEIDQDGDGIVYQIMDKDDEEAQWCDGDAYNVWMEKYLSNTKEIDTEYRSIIPEDIEALVKEYNPLLINEINELSEDGIIDLGSIYIEEKLSGDNDSIRDRLKNQFTFVKGENDIGGTVFEGYVEDDKYIEIEARDLIYMKNLDDYKILGIQIGDSLSDAVGILERLGFKESTTTDQYVIYRNGICFNSVYVRITFENDVVTSISIGDAFKYAG